ncbi:putative uncharacterized protein C1orf229 [Falco biarmicus]|uniref:putative uncharacterized protein C1orf229 n=1 Tax=Falco rusticolus TaxID=120794 RepID=UPI00188695B1|nr:putative uncharacterized protein C1orf229 [Falco rusticolus]XP_056203375.1 putative uncharacterized protein C1orf229 [Falco biarmicus]
MGRAAPQASLPPRLRAPCGHWVITTRRCLLYGSAQQPAGAGSAEGERAMRRQVSGGGGGGVGRARAGRRCHGSSAGGGVPAVAAVPGGRGGRGRRESVPAATGPEDFSARFEGKSLQLFNVEPCYRHRVRSWAFPAAAGPGRARRERCCRPGPAPHPGLGPGPAPGPGPAGPHRPPPCPFIAMEAAAGRASPPRELLASPDPQPHRRPAAGARCTSGRSPPARTEG